MERIFRRKLYDSMLEWKNTQNGSTALLIEGARRVGISTLVELFARQEYESYILIENHNYEIDFLLSRGSKLWPLEVKSSGYKTHASLDAFCKKFSSRVDKRFLIYGKDLQKDEQTLLLPVYMTPCLYIL